MSITSYSELQTAVLNWLGRSSDTEIIARVPEAIALFEARARRRLKGRVGEVRSANASISVEYTALPSDIVKLRSVRLTGTAPGPVHIVPDEVLNAISDGSAGNPTRCSQVGTSLRVFPIPSSATPIEIVYTRLAPLSSAAPTNWLLDLAPDVYLNGTLGVIGGWMSHEQADEFEGKANAYIDEVNKAYAIGRSAGDLQPTFIGGRA